MALTDFLLKVVTDEEYINAFATSDNTDEQQALLDRHGVTPDEQQLLHDRDLSKLRVQVQAEFELDPDDAAAIVTIHAARSGVTIYVPPPPPPPEAS
jgi:hypothetical protein